MLINSYNKLITGINLTLKDMRMIELTNDEALILKAITEDEKLSCHEIFISDFYSRPEVVAYLNSLQDYGFISLDIKAGINASDKHLDRVHYVTILNMGRDWADRQED